jgi:hypothetical protein
MRESAAELKGTGAVVAAGCHRRRPGGAARFSVDASAQALYAFVVLGGDGTLLGGPQPATEHRFEHRTVHTRQRDNLADVAVAGQR